MKIPIVSVFKNQDIFWCQIYYLSTHAYFRPLFLPPPTPPPHEPCNHTRSFLPNRLSPQNTRQTHISHLPCTTSGTENPWWGSGILTKWLFKINHSLHSPQRWGGNEVGGWVNQPCQHHLPPPFPRMYIPFGSSLIPYRWSHLVTNIIRKCIQIHKQNTLRPFPSKESPTIIIIFCDLTKQED